MVRGSELRLPGGKERSDRGWLRALRRLLRLRNEKRVLGFRQQAWAGRSREKEAERGFILPLVTVGAQVQVKTLELRTPKKETPRCTQPGLSPALKGGRDPTSPGHAQPQPPIAAPKDTSPQATCPGSWDEMGRAQLTQLLPPGALPMPLALLLLLIHLHVRHQNVLLSGFAGAGGAAAVAGALKGTTLDTLSPPVEDQGRGHQGQEQQHCHQHHHQGRRVLWERCCSKMDTRSRSPAGPPPKKFGEKESQPRLPLT